MPPLHLLYIYVHCTLYCPSCRQCPNSCLVILFLSSLPLLTILLSAPLLVPFLLVQLFSSCCCNYTVSFLLFSFYNLILILILPFSVANYHKQSDTLFFISSQSYSLFPLLQSSHFLSLTILHHLILSFLHSSKQFSVQTYPYPLAFFYTANLLILLLFHCY